ncbi:MAG TPA: amino acid adenylation domain-containing protein, partial [Bacteroidetes bacterium]|nr:amino acid adenylation domain-containing protein [Bacteroidota bacterium]
MKKLDLGELQVEPLEVDTQTAKFDLSLAIVEGEERFRGILEFNTDLFDRDTVERLGRHFVHLLREVVEEPERPVLEASLLPEGERREILARHAAGPKRNFGEFAPVHRMFSTRAGQSPDAPAVLHGEQVWTYGELEARSNRLSRFLVDRGVEREDVVAVLLERSVDLLVSMLAVLKAGAAYVPVDPSLPVERLSHILRESGARVVLTSGELPNGLGDGSWSVFDLEKLEPEISTLSTKAPEVHVEPENLAYVIFTSGSSGQPKGVAVQHGGLANHVLTLTEAMGLGEGERVLQYITPSFDASAEEIYPTLAAGATLVLPPSAKELSATDVVRIAEESHVTVLHLPVPIWHLIVDTLHEEGRRFPASVRLVMVGGEAPAVGKLSEAASLLDRPLDFMNLYGPTEATITSTFYRLRLEPGQEVRLPVVPIGKPIANVRTCVLDRGLNPVPVGVVGELFIGGAGVSRGYLGRPDLTAEAFVPDPFAERAGARMYRTGDLVRLNRDGDLVFVGRLDFQVKIRGLRIELGEIEHHLAAHPGVKQAVVEAKSTPRGVQLVAYVIPVDRDALTPRDLREHLKARLPDYMVPAHYLFLDSFPTTPSGKIDRRRLPVPDLSADTGREPPVPPRNEREATLLEIWKQVLRVENFGVRDNFFELGGDSILSIQVVARANQAGLKITPKQLFEHPTVEELAAVAEEGVAIHAEQGPVSGAFPTTPIQRWFFELNLAHPEQWNQSVALRLKQSLDADALRKATAALVEHHDLLRARFRRTEDGWEGQIPERLDEVPFREYDFRS